MTLTRKYVLAAALVATVAFGAGASAQPGNAEAMLGKYVSIEPSMAGSPFKRPLVLESTPSSSRPRGDVYAIVDHPFALLTQALQRADHWCDMLILPFNVKRCVASAGPSRALLRLAVGTKAYQPVEETQEIEFRYAVRAAQANYLSVQMDADSGPLGTSDYRLALEATPLDAKRSFVHMSYAYANGLAARMATSAYLASAGRDKVGFSVTGTDAAGKAVFVGGMQGVAERNTMRYFLAIEAFLDSLSVPANQQAETRLRQWFAATERYPRQLHEMPLDEYLAMKRREIHGRAAPASPAGE